MCWVWICVQMRNLRMMMPAGWRHWRPGHSRATHLPRIHMLGTMNPYLKKWETGSLEGYPKKQEFTAPPVLVGTSPTSVCNSRTCQISGITVRKNTSCERDCQSALVHHTIYVVIPTPRNQGDLKFGAPKWRTILLLTRRANARWSRNSRFLWLTVQSSFISDHYSSHLCLLDLIFEDVSICRNTCLYPTTST
jgi:hypothetical protein